VYRLGALGAVDVEHQQLRHLDLPRGGQRTRRTLSRPRVGLKAASRIFIAHEGGEAVMANTHRDGGTAGPTTEVRTTHNEFGSKDQNGQQVDDGTYKIVDDRTFVVDKEFPDVTIHYRIAGDTIRFDPVAPSCAPNCDEAVWSVMMAFPGETWERVS
jgi:hypothetical protein